MVITIDGPVAAGKTTVAEKVATCLDFTLLDTGAIYRALALYARQQGVSWSDEAGLARLAARLPLSFRRIEGRNAVLLADSDVSEAIREPEISRGASLVSALPAVREALLQLQRDLGARADVVAEGRDTGTVVFPDAAAKFFLSATPEERARRRHRELQQKGRPDSLDHVLEALRERDERDSGRAAAPLVPAADAVLIDTTAMTAEQVTREILRHLSRPEGAGP